MAKPIRLNFVADQAQQSKVFIVPFWLFTYLGIFFGEIKQLRFISFQIKILVTARPEILEPISLGYDNGRKSQTKFLVFKKGVR